jgi:hypothetical protein
MKKLLFLILIFLSSRAFSQTDYYQYDPNTGASTKVGYSRPSNEGVTFSPYVETNPVNAMVAVGMYKQQQYNNNSRNIRSVINDISGLLSSINKYDPDFVTQATNNINDYISQINKLDWTDENNYQSIMNNLASYKTYVENSEQTIMDNYYKNKHQ